MRHFIEKFIVSTSNIKIFFTAGPVLLRNPIFLCFFREGAFPPLDPRIIFLAVPLVGLWCVIVSASGNTLFERMVYIGVSVIA